ncbi:MAG TPA: long-chain fatty acid--CoA ligase [Acidimicrobiaceae bacterium]|jgi:long-chain acyl-CoA synthetase|nr:long-chain fatty acid--CoA ligase [Acidimicrobiaceae bacterium]HAZ36193.1 long-chain fatty acid--CoA ligase [Acidimicrobiaceae bacterium]HBA94994.1 long-chain fatty acid--CoA ligase [Acidimicrobiaceae bacterium]
MTLVVEERSSTDAPTPTVTVASLARGWGTSDPGRIAMREKDFGIWQEYSWARTWELILDAAHGLLALGIEVGDRVSIQAEDRPEWVILDLATVAVRGITVGFYPTNPAAEVEYLLTDCGATVHLAEDQEQVDRVLEIDPAMVPNLSRIIYCEPRGVRTYSDDRLMDWHDFLTVGRQHRAENPDVVVGHMAEARPDDVMTLVYTSGTTGPPKGAMLTNANTAFCITRIIGDDGLRGNQVPTADDLVVTYLPLCHVAERIFSTWHMVSCGLCLNFAESIETVTANLREVQPTLFFAVPRIWEKLHASVMIKGTDASPFKRLWLRFGLKLASVIGREKVANGGLHTTKSRLLNLVGYPLVFRALQERIGLRRCWHAGSGAAPIAPEVLEFFTGIGVPVYELYGMTENAAVATGNFPGRMVLGTVGEPYPDIGFRLDEETGEIQTKHPGVFAGYWNRPEQTAATFTEDGWLMTGDVGEWVGGSHVRIIDRIKDIIITAGGKNISPSEIENSLKTSPYVKEAMVIGDRRKFLSALIGIELDTVGDWALRRNIPYTTYRDLSEKPEVLELIQGVVNETNEKFARVESIREFRMIPKELDHEDGELTATQKIKRSAMEDAFGGLIEEMYA